MLEVVGSIPIPSTICVFASHISNTPVKNQVSFRAIVTLSNFITEGLFMTIKLYASKNVLLLENQQYCVQPALIEVQGTKIKSVQNLSLKNYATAVKEEAQKRNLSVQDFGDRLISPAFVNCHTHVAMNFFRALPKGFGTQKNIVEETFFKAETLIRKEDILAFSRLGCYENLLNGVGTIWDHYYHAESVAQACLDTGLSGVVAPTLQDLNGPGMHAAEAALAETVRIDESATFFENGVFAAVGPHAVDSVSPKLWAQALHLAKRLNIPIHAHVAQSYEEFVRIQERHQQSPVEFLHAQNILQEAPAFLLVHGIYISEKDFSFLQAKKNALVFCPFSQLIYQLCANVLEWEKHQCTWFVATDSVASNDSMNLQKELRFVGGFPNLALTFELGRILNDSSAQENNSFLQKQTAAKSAQNVFSNNSFLLKKVFAGPGQFHTKFKTGVIEANAQANFIVWDTSHPSFWPAADMLRNLAMGDTTGAIYNMCVNGKWMGQDGHFAQSILCSAAYVNSVKEADVRFKHLQRNIKL